MSNITDEKEKEQRKRIKELLESPECYRCSELIDELESSSERVEEYRTALEEIMAEVSPKFIAHEIAKKALTPKEEV